MLILGIDTATEISSIGICHGAEFMGELSFSAATSCGERLIPAIDQLLDINGVRKEELELIAVSAGPGSFTGLRIGMAAAKGLALALSIPLVGVPTMESYAVKAEFWPGKVCTILPDRRNLVYYAVFAHGEKIVEERSVSMEALLEEIIEFKDEIFFIGPGAERHRQEIEKLERGAEGTLQIASAALNWPSALNVARLGAQKFKENKGINELYILEPLYAQRPLAENKFQVR